LFEHDLFGKPVATFPDHALGTGRFNFLKMAKGEENFPGLIAVGRPHDGGCGIDKTLREPPYS
jgi:hypothetical protein